MTIIRFACVNVTELATGPNTGCRMNCSNGSILMLPADTLLPTLVTSQLVYRHSFYWLGPRGIIRRHTFITPATPPNSTKMIRNSGMVCSQ